MEQLQSFLWSLSPGPGSGARDSIWRRDPLRGSTQLQGQEVCAEEGDDEVRLLLWVLLIRKVVIKGCYYSFLSEVFVDQMCFLLRNVIFCNNDVLETFKLRQNDFGCSSL